MKPASKDDITPQEYWRLRYAAFLCAIFDVLSTLVAEGAFPPPQFAQRLEARRSELLDDIIKSSRVSPPVSDIFLEPVPDDMRKVTEAGFIERYRNRTNPKETCTCH
jgi:hypothetical protein